MRKLGSHILLFGQIAPFGGAKGAVALAACCAVGVFGCSEPKSDDSLEFSAPVPSAPPAPLPPSVPTASAEPAPEPEDSGAPAPAGIIAGALFMHTPIMSEMEWPAKTEGSSRRGIEIGYLRQGARIAVLPNRQVRANCTDGWYELVSGGFVCGRFLSLDLEHPRLRVAPHVPFAEGPLPYEYGYNLTNGTPLYRHIPSREERVAFEPWLTRKAKKQVEPEETYAPSLLLAFADRASGASDMVEEDGGTPWYLREYDGGKPSVTLDELRGPDGTPIERRMVRGFYLALDQEITHNNTKWWKTTGNLLAPSDRIYVSKNVTEFHGLWMREERSDVEAAGDTPGGGVTAQANDTRDKRHEPRVAFVLWAKAHKYSLSDDKKKAKRIEPVSRFTVVRLTGSSRVVGGYRFDETNEGWWLRANEGTRALAGPPPSDLAPGEKWIDVNLTTQTLVAFEGTTPVFATLVSTGKKDHEDKEKDFQTPTGTFRIREKHVAATMDGDVASDGPYSIEDVPWIMYFNGSYALHGAFWHTSFGRTRSHGCVNLAPYDARALFRWSDPPVPEGWHGSMATSERPGTRVVVHE